MNHNTKDDIVQVSLLSISRNVTLVHQIQRQLKIDQIKGKKNMDKSRQIERKIENCWKNWNLCLNNRHHTIVSSIMLQE